jgi:hypothetical protein
MGATDDLEALGLTEAPEDEASAVKLKGRPQGGGKGRRWTSHNPALQKPRVPWEVKPQAARPLWMQDRTLLPLKPPGVK